MLWTRTILSAPNSSSSSSSNQVNEPLLHFGCFWAQEYFSEALTPKLGKMRTGKVPLRKNLSFALK